MPTHPHARLAIYRRTGNQIYFRIGHADNFAATLAAFKQRVPSHARRWNPDTKEWRVSAAYEPVLRDLFANYDYIATGVYPPRTTPAAPTWKPYQSRYGRPARQSSRIRPMHWALLLAVAVGVYWIITTQLLSPPHSPNPAATPPIVTAGSPVATRPPAPTANPSPSLAPTPTSAPLAACPATRPTNATPAQVTHIVDGDTIDVRLNGNSYRVRYIGMDTPERGQPGYSEATARNSQLVSGKTVYLEKDVRETGPYGRLLRYIYLDDGTMVNQRLVVEGFAQVATYPPDTKYVDCFRQAQTLARDAGLGLWSN